MFFCKWQNENCEKTGYIIKRICLFRQCEYALYGTGDIFCPYASKKEAEKKCDIYKVEYGVNSEDIRKKS